MGEELCVSPRLRELYPNHRRTLGNAHDEYKCQCSSGASVGGCKQSLNSSVSCLPVQTGIKYNEQPSNW